MLNGRIGQVVGPFTAGVDLLADNAPIGAFTPETTRPILYKLGIQTAGRYLGCNWRICR